MFVANNLDQLNESHVILGNFALYLKRWNTDNERHKITI